MISEDSIYLNCPFSEKEEAKQLGAQFDWAEKKWFIPAGFEIEPFAKWLPKALAIATDNSDSLSLNDLLLSVQNTLAEQYNSRYWVRAEVVSLSKNLHVYLELADYDSQGNEVAKARATLWNHRAKELLETFELQTGMPFKAGLKVLLQIRVEFHSRYGFSLDILDIDPNFTLGEMEAKLNRIREKLKKDGFYTLNQQLPKVTEFCQVAVIAPPLAAGLGDFKSVAEQLEAASLCQFHYYQASFQGQKSLSEIPATFQLINQDHQTEQFDAIVMIRGGGSKADLFQLNEYEVVKAVCTAQLPVMVGIGHERDKTLLDEVANQVAHTPSLVISNIASTIIQNARNARQNWQMVTRLTEKILQSAKADNQRLNAQIREQSVRLLAEQRQKVASLLQQIKSCSETQLNQAGHQIKLFMEQVLLGDPKTILNRGYAIIRNSQNQVISNKAAAIKEKSLVIEFKDGRVTVMNN